MKDWPSDLERALIAQRGKEDFWYFAMEVFGIAHNPLGGKWIDPKIHLPLCRWFEAQIRTWLADRAAGRRERRYIAILVPRAVGKSTLITQAGMIWAQLQDPNISCYIGNEKRENSIDFLSSIKEQLEGSDRFSKFAWLYGSWKTNEKRWRQDSLVHAARTTARKDVSFGVWGIESGLTSKHPDILCLDDLVSYESVKQDGGWFDLIYSHIAALIPVVEVDGLVILIGTRYGDNDPFGRSFKSDGIASVAGFDSAIYKPNGGKWHVYFVPGVIVKDGKKIYTCRKTWPAHEVESYYARDPKKCAAQVYNDPAATPFRPLVESQFDSLIRPLSDVPKNARLSFHFDTAFKDTAKQANLDSSVILVAAHDPKPSGRVWILDCASSSLWRVEDFQRALIALARKHIALGRKFSVLSDERTIGGLEGAWPLLLKSWFADAKIVPQPAMLMLPRDTKTKKSRKHFESIGFITAGNVFFVEDCPHLPELRYQLCNVSNSEHDDFADAFADVFHPEVFRVLRSLPPEPAERLHRPWDETISGTRDIWRRHDRLYQDYEFGPRPPI